MTDKQVTYNCYFRSLCFFKKIRFTKKLFTSVFSQEIFVGQNIFELQGEHPGSDAVNLSNGHWMIVYNDTNEERHSLAVSLSTDKGKTWAYTRHLTLDQQNLNNRFAYPSIIQGTDWNIHIVYSVSLKEETGEQRETIRIAQIKEDWVIQGDSK